MTNIDKAFKKLLLERADSKENKHRHVLFSDLDEQTFKDYAEEIGGVSTASLGIRLAAKLLRDRGLK